MNDSHNVPSYGFDTFVPVSGTHPDKPAVDPVKVSGDPDTTPDKQNLTFLDEGQEPDPAPSGQTATVPDGWITRTVAQEQLALAGIELDSRRIRHLCARNELESVKVKNEKNQPQYFINPASLVEYIDKNRPAHQSGISPDKPPIMPDEEIKVVEEPNPAPSGQTHIVPDQQLDPNRAGEWVPKEQLEQALETIEFLKEEIRDSRQLKRDLKEISSEMLETFTKVATNRQLPARPERTQSEIIHSDVHESQPATEHISRPGGV